MEEKTKNSEQKMSGKEVNKYFDSKNYNTIIVHTDGHSKKENDIGEVIISLIDGKLSKEDKDQALVSIKENNNPAILLNSISTIENPDKKALLIATFWEVGFAADRYFLFFVDLVCVDHFEVALEAITVIDTIENEILPGDLAKAKEMVTKKLKENPITDALLGDLLKFINNRIL